LIAEKDLELRGPGEILGSRQSGDALLRFVDLQREQGLITQVQKLAWVMMDQHPEHIHAHLVRWLSHRVDFVKA
jgi:ATP-dependent DNA helicase RecG